MNPESLAAIGATIATILAGAYAVLSRRNEKNGATSQQFREYERHTEELIMVLREQLERCEMIGERARREVERLHEEIRDLRRRMP